MPPEIRTVAILVKSNSGKLVDSASVTITFGSGTTTDTTNASGEVTLNAANAGATIGDEVTIKAVSEGNGQVSQSLTLTSAPQSLTMTLTYTSDISFYENEDSLNRYRIVGAIALDYQGNPITPGNPLPIADAFLPDKYDFASLSQATTTDTWTFKTGGASGTVVATVTITYTTSSKTIISTVAKV